VRESSLLNFKSIRSNLGYWHLHLLQK
jgi:hypothetical protein